MTSKPVILAGNGTTAEIMASHLEIDAEFDLKGCVVDSEYVDSSRVTSVPSVSLADLAARFDPRSHEIIMAVGYDDLNRTRAAMFERLKEIGYTISRYLHPRANIHSHDALGEGCIVLPGATIEPGASVGANTVIWSNVTIGHHAHIAENCWIAAGTVIAGSATVGRNCFVGVNATIVNEKSVGALNIIGAGALISRNTDPDTVHLARSAEPVRFSAQDYVTHFGV